MGKKELRVAVVGAGRGPSGRTSPDGSDDERVEVATIVDNPTLAKETADQFGIARAVSDYREVLDDPTIDVVDVTTGNDTHFEISWASLEAGKHVLCEKPVHHDARETSRGRLWPRRRA